MKIEDENRIIDDLKRFNKYNYVSPVELFLTTEKLRKEFPDIDFEYFFEKAEERAMNEMSALFARNAEIEEKLEKQFNLDFCLFFLVVSVISIIIAIWIGRFL